MSYSLRSNKETISAVTAQPLVEPIMPNSVLEPTKQPVVDIPGMQAISENPGLAALLQYMQSQFHNSNIKLSEIRDDCKRLESIEAKLANQDVRISAVETSTSDNSEKIATLQANFKQLKQENKRNAVLRALYDRKLNGLLHGIKEGHKETRSDSKELVVKFFREALKLNNADDITIVDCHRLPLEKPTNASNKIRPIIVKFLTQADKDCVFSQGTELKEYNRINDLSCYITGHLPPAMQRQRKLLLPKFKKARLEKSSTRWLIDFTTGDYYLQIGDVKHYARDDDNSNEA